MNTEEDLLVHCELFARKIVNQEVQRKTFKSKPENNRKIRTNHLTKTQATSVKQILNVSRIHRKKTDDYSFAMNSEEVLLVHCGLFARKIINQEVQRKTFKSKPENNKKNKDKSFDQNPGNFNQTNPEFQQNPSQKD